MPPVQTPSTSALNILQARFGSANYSSWQSIRKRWWSFVNYPEAGGTTFNFFGSAVGQNGVTREQTNMPQAGTFGQTHFLLKNIGFVIKIDTWALTDYDGTDASTLTSDFLLGLLKAGYARLTINSRPFWEAPLPFLYAPPFDGREVVVVAGITALTLAEGTPNTLAGYTGAPPYATQERTRDAYYRVDPQILIEAQQGFEVSLTFPSGLVPVIGTDITDDTTNPLQIGCIMDGVQFRPVQ